MEKYPEKTCTTEKLVRSPRLVELAVAGKKTEQRRNGVYAYPGETFELNGVKFEITGLVRQRLGDMTDKDAATEGYPNLAVYQEIIIKMHSGMKWNENALVWVHQFKKLE